MSDALRPASSIEERLLDTVEAVVAAARDAGGRVIVAFSGGLDSSVLLHAAARVGPPGLIEAVHADHGWHEDSAAWAAGCVERATRLGLRCRVERVDAAPAPGQSPEEAARLVRYAAFERLLEDGDTLLTAHHGDDQLETMLIRLLRGAGVRGMRAIHDEGPCGRGRLVRPLLAFSRAELEQLASLWQLDWVVDPSNADPRFDRGYLRSRILPAVRARWPAAHRVAHRVARHMRDADELLDALAAIDAEGLADPARVPLARLTSLNDQRLANVLRYLLHRACLGVPDERRLGELARLIRVGGGAQGTARVAWRGGEARIYGAHLYLLAPIEDAMHPDTTGIVGIDRPWEGTQGRVELVEDGADGIPESWARAGLRIAFRQGGERFRPAGSAHHRRLKQWFQEERVLPWMRDVVPLLYHGDELIAVADLALAAMPQRNDGSRWRPVWTGHGRLR